MLCSVALLTVVPPTNTGCSRATGVSSPVRPTWNSMPMHRGVASCAGNLWATAQRGARDTKPSSPGGARVDLVDDAVDLVGQRRAARADVAGSTRGSPPRPAPPAPPARSAIPIARTPAAARCDGRARSRPRPGRRRTERCPAGALAVMRGSSWRRLPAAALRGLTKTFSPRACGLCIHALEAGDRHEDLAAHLEQRRRRAAQPQRHAADRADVGRDVLALSPSPRVAACTSTPCR